MYINQNPPITNDNKIKLWIGIIASLKRGFQGQNVPKTVASLAQKGESANNRRLGFVCYKHALIRFLNRFTWKRIQVLRRKHATLWVRKTFPVLTSFETPQFNPSEAGRSFRKMNLQWPNAYPPLKFAPRYKSLYMALFSCVNAAIAICGCWTR